ncbi:unnamed protein product, partial [Prorocentrum cordatum]
MLSTAQYGASEIVAFGLERELEYRGHITPADHLVPLPRRTFASADARQIRVWGPDGDITRYTFPSARRSMVTAMAYCPAHQAVLTTELDLTVKVYGTERMDLLENFSLEQLRKQSERRSAAASAGSAKVAALCYLEKHGWVLVGGEGGCELWRLYKSVARRDTGSTAFRLALDLVRVVTKEPISRAVEAHTRILMWGPRSLLVFDSELEPIVSIADPHAAHVSTACLNLVSSLDTELLSGAEDGTVRSWSVHMKPKLLNAADSGQGEARASVESRLQHEFHAHARPVEMVSWYDRPQRGLRQRLFVSYARDGKVKVWSLEAFALVYALDLSMLDATATLFPVSPHHFAISSAQETPDGLGQSAILTLLRFNAHVAAPFATSNQSPVVLLAQPPLSPGFLRHGRHYSPVAQGEGDAAVLVSEDTAVRVVGMQEPSAVTPASPAAGSGVFAGGTQFARATSVEGGGQGSPSPSHRVAHLISTLPPPPNSKVHVLGAFLVPVWQLLVLWLSTKEVAVFFVPAMSTRPSKARQYDSPTAGLFGGKEASSDASARVKSATTPLLLRRFGSHEVQARLPDKGLPREAFSSVALHHGPPPEEFDGVLVAGLTGKRSPPPRKDPDEVEPDWFLMVGTDLGTLQAFRLRDMLAALPIWERLASQLPAGAWGSPELGRDGAARAQHSPVDECVNLETPVPRPSGQRPFPHGAATVKLHGRWKCHNYTVEVTSAMGGRALTVDAKRNLRLWRLEDMSLVYSHRLCSHVCHAPFVRQPLRSQELAVHESEKRASLVLSGLACGKANGHLELVSESDDGPVVLHSSASHSDGTIAVDYLWPSNIFVSAGKDDSIKIWSRGLGLLREILFPQALTAVAFRRHHCLDQQRGHGDVLVGFAAHVEQIPFEVWSRGIVKAPLGPRDKGARAVTTTAQDLPAAPGAEHAGEEEAVDMPEERRRSALRQPSVPQAQESEPSSAEEAPQEAAEARRRRAYFADFRGDPALPHLGALVGQSAVAKAPVGGVAQGPRVEAKGVRHAAVDAPDPGDFQAVTRRDVGYFDKAVVPSPVVDARRAEAIRGAADERGVALVTSVGSRYLNVPPPPEAPAAARARAPGAQEPAAGRPPVRDEPRADPPAPGLVEEEMLSLGLLAIGPGQRSLAGRAADLGQEFEKLPLLPDSDSAPLGRPALRRGSTHRLSTLLSGLGAAGAAKARANPGALLLFGPQAGAPRPQAGEGRRRSAAKPDAPPRAPPQGRAAAAAPGPPQADGAGRRASNASSAGPGMPSPGPPSPGESTGEDTAEEEMRSRRAARGLRGGGGRARAPKAQHVANTPGDTARLLEARGAVEEAPEVSEENFLKRMVVQRTEWLYLPAGHEALERQKAESRRLQRRQGCSDVEPQACWSPAGRMVMHGHLAPTSALPDGIVPQVPVQQTRRAPMTRGEVTEQRLIESARAGPPLSQGARVESSRHELIRLGRLELEHRAPHSARAYTGAAEWLQRDRRKSTARELAAAKAGSAALAAKLAAEAQRDNKCGSVHGTSVRLSFMTLAGWAGGGALGEGAPGAEPRQRSTRPGRAPPGGPGSRALAPADLLAHLQNVWTRAGQPDIWRKFITAAFLPGSLSPHLDPRINRPEFVGAVVDGWESLRLNDWMTLTLSQQRELAKQLVQAQPGDGRRDALWGALVVRKEAGEHRDANMGGALVSSEVDIQLGFSRLLGAAEGIEAAQPGAAEHLVALLAGAVERELLPAEFLKSARRLRFGGERGVQAPVPDEVLECGLLGLDEADLGRCCPACGRWRRAAEADALWQPLLRRNFAGRPYRTLLTAEGVVAWLARADRERAAEEVLGSRGHLRELQRSPRLKDLLRYLRHRHNGVEVELLSAKPAQPWFNVGLVNARLTLEIVNFWPHCSTPLRERCPSRSPTRAPPAAATWCWAARPGCAAGRARRCRAGGWDRAGSSSWTAAPPASSSGSRGCPAWRWARTVPRATPRAASCASSSPWADGHRTRACRWPRAAPTPSWTPPWATPPTRSRTGRHRRVSTPSGSRADRYPAAFASLALRCTAPSWTWTW